MPRAVAATVSLLLPLFVAACAPGTDLQGSGSTTTSATVTTGTTVGSLTGQGDLWADGTYDGVPFSVRCSGDQIVGTRGQGSPAPTTLSCTDHDAGYNVLLIALSPSATTYTDCDLQQSLSITPTDGESQLSCVGGAYTGFELAVASVHDTPDGGVWWQGDFELVMDDGAHSIDVVGGFDAASPAF